MTTAIDARTPLLELRHVSKRFGGELALDDVCLTVAEGEIHALVGQNGSGKSTLIKVLTGFHAPESGAEVVLRGVDAALGVSSVESSASALPIRVVHQDAALVPGLNTIDNIALSAGYLRGRAGRVDWKRQRALTQDALDLVRAEDIDLDVPVSALSVIQRAQIAIARALVGWERAGGMLLLDEPTSALSETEANRLFEILDELRVAGISILYVSHRLDEVLRISDHVTVIRDGHYIGTKPAGDISYDELVALMVGSVAELADDQRIDPSLTDAHAAPMERSDVVAVRGLVSDVVRGVSFEIRPGEILGITGLAGAGHEELPRLLVGLDRARTGQLAIGAQTIELGSFTPADALGAGIALVPADRTVSGLVTGFDVGSNITLPRASQFLRRGWLRRNAERQDADEWIDSLGVRPAAPKLPVLSLSGGNQQKVVIAKCLAIGHRGLVLSDPTAGVDVGARASIYHRFRDEAARGLPILVCSSDPEDLVHLCDRVLVMSKGQVVDELVGAQITKKDILHACGRHSSAPEVKPTPRIAHSTR